MDTGKYIIIREFKGMDMVPIVFPAFIQHDAMVNYLGLQPKDIDSAGFVFSSNVDPSDPHARSPIHCYGRSTSLKKESKGERDSRICSRMFQEERL